MFNRHLLLVAGLSLVAGTAEAAIPDASGVYHGCYNLLSGSLKLIDGTSCGLLERHVTWQQRGPQGPAGQSVTSAPLSVGDSSCPTGGVALTLAGNTTYVCNGAQGQPGQPGPEGPAAKVFMGTETIVPDLQGSFYQHEVYTQPITAEADGKCMVTLNFVLGFPSDVFHPRDPGAPVDPNFVPFPSDAVLPEFTVRSVYKEDVYGTNVSDRKAVMTGPRDRKSATVTDIIELEAGKAYRFGGMYSLGSVDFVLNDDNNYVNVFWNCMYY